MSDLAIGLQVLGHDLESLGHALVHRFAVLNLWTAALLGGALILDSVLARRVRASWRIALYAPVALRILLPLDWSLQLITPRVASFLTPLAVPVRSHTHDLPTWQVPSTGALVAVLYLTVALLLAGRAVLARVRLHRAIAGAAPVVESAHGELPCPVLQHDDLGPMAVGLLWPRIVLPRRLLAMGEEHALSCVLRHESAHLGRGDAWLAAGMELLAVLAWPVAPLWIAMARVRQLVELACDEAALAGAPAVERRRYGHALLDIAEWRSRTVVPFGAGELHFGSTLRARIEALAPRRQWPTAAQALAVSCAPVVMLAACSGSTSATARAGEADETSYGYQFDNDSAARAAALPGAAAAPTLNADGRVSPEIIASTVRGHLAAFRTCYEAGTRKDPALKGTVTVSYTIGMDGATTGATDAKSTLPDRDVVACIVGEFGKLTYPAGPGVVTVVYPIDFAP